MILIAVSPLTALPAPAPAAPPQYRIEVAVYQGDPRGGRDRTKVSLLSQPLLTAEAKQKVSCFVGQTIPFAGEPLDVGIRVTATPEPLRGGKVKVKLVVQVDNLQLPDDRTTVMSTKASIAPTLTPRQTQRFYLAGKGAEQTWIDVTVDK
jgi:hypothetical protein